MRTRRIFRRAAILSTTLLALFILLDHLSCFGYHGNDWTRCDARQFQVINITAQGDLILDQLEMKVHLLGVIPGEDTTEYLSKQTRGKRVILKLESPQTRDAEGRLLAYVYLDVSDCLNVDLVREGFARADRGNPYLMRALVERAEADARKHQRGLWKKSP